MDTPAVILKPGREKSVLRGHPWLFSGAVERIEGDPASGETVAVRSSAGEYLGLAAFSPESNIRLRLWTRVEGVRVDEVFIRARLVAALARRAGLGAADEPLAAHRLCHAESDAFPGLIVDRYADTLVVQFLSAGAEFWREAIVTTLGELTGAARIYERSDAEVRALEGLERRTGALAGPEPEDPVEISEGGLRFLVDVRGGQKTGFYLDQRVNRALVREMASDCELLNAFAYTGGFTAAALAGGARSVVSIESSSEAVALGEENLRLNGFEPDRNAWIEGDVFAELRTLRDRDASFDLIVLDPPKFAATRRQAEAAARGYKDINLYALKLLRPGGTLVTFSCSGGIDRELFQKIVAGAAADADVEGQIVRRLEQSPDHPVRLSYPEGDYLKGLVLRAI
ncbi:MAG TPA: class I SAM-dependent rRNA methyltransferase [Anaerolineales bacterium]|nr:class I SAM-dependent rRNA methyltransferase [Anaerolineales bacterium]